MPEQTIAHDLVLPKGFQSLINRDAYLNFLDRLCQQKEIKYAVLTLPAGSDDILTYLNLWQAKNEFMYYWEKPFKNFAITAGGTLLEITAKGSTRFEDAYTAIQKANAQTLHLNEGTVSQTSIRFLGGFSFIDDEATGIWKPFGEASFVLPKRMAAKNKDKTTISVALKIEEDRTASKIHKAFFKQLQNMKMGTKIESTKSSLPAQNLLHKYQSANQDHYRKWIKSVEDAKQKIIQEKLEKVVITRQIKLLKDESQTPVKIIGRLRKQYPTCCTFLIRKKNSPAFIGCSPERLLSFQGHNLQTEALAGSFARGADQKEDSTFKNALLKSDKNNREHQFVVASIKQDLAPFVNNLQRSEQAVVKKLPNVQHLYTPIYAKLRKDMNPLTLLGKLHPTPAVGGTPKNKALAYIRQHESFSRGWYASPVGWINAEDEGEFTVAIRSGLISKTSALLFAGCGIVADSDPQTEWEETNLKFMPMLSALNYD